MRPFVTGLILMLTAAFPVIADAQDNDAAMALQMADNLRKTGRPAEALNILGEALAKEPSNPRILSRIGYTLIATGRPEEAVGVFDQLLAITPDDAMAYAGKAVAFDNAGNHVAAQELYEKALSIAPNSPAIKNNMALSMIMNGQTDEAIRLLEPLANAPDAPAVFRQNLALAYGVRGDHERAFDLNLKDMEPEKARENQHFYDHYAKLLKARQASELALRMQPIPELAEPESPEAALAPSAAKPAVKKPAIADPEPLPEPETKARETSSPFGQNAEYSFPTGNSRR